MEVHSSVRFKRFWFELDVGDFLKAGGLWDSDLFLSGGQGFQLILFDLWLKCHFWSYGLNLCLYNRFWHNDWLQIVLHLRMSADGLWIFMANHVQLDRLNWDVYGLFRSFNWFLSLDLMSLIFLMKFNLMNFRWCFNFFLDKFRSNISWFHNKWLLWTDVDSALDDGFGGNLTHTFQMLEWRWCSFYDIDVGKRSCFWLNW